MSLHVIWAGDGADALIVSKSELEEAINEHKELLASGEFPNNRFFVGQISNIRLHEVKLIDKYVYDSEAMNLLTASNEDEDEAEDENSDEKPINFLTPTSLDHENTPSDEDNDNVSP